jgi:hypothetical protein
MAAEIIPIAAVRRSRRRERERAHARACLEIIEANLQLTLHLFVTGREADRPVRARQLRQLAELLEYVAGDCSPDDRENPTSADAGGLGE